MSELCRVSIDENNHQHWLSGSDDDEYFDEDEAMEQYYDDKYGDE